MPAIKIRADRILAESLLIKVIATAVKHSPPIQRNTPKHQICHSQEVIRDPQSQSLLSHPLSPLSILWFTGDREYQETPLVTPLHHRLDTRLHFSGNTSPNFKEQILVIFCTRTWLNYQPGNGKKWSLKKNINYYPSNLLPYYTSNLIGH